MDKDKINAQHILQEKQMEDLYQIKEVRHFVLPIAKHKVTINYKARFKYTILEYQALRFIAAAQNTIQQDEIIAALGLSKGEATAIFSILVNDRVIEYDQNILAITTLGELSFKDGYSPSRQEMRNFEFYYEPVSSHVVEEIQQYQVHREDYHPIIHSENYRLLDCPLVEEANIIQLYEDIFAQSLMRQTKDFQLGSIQHEGEETSYCLPIQNLQLFELEKGEEIRSVWNPKNHRFIHLA